MLHFVNNLEKNILLGNNLNFDHFIFKKFYIVHLELIYHNFIVSGALYMSIL